jgi:arylsulfatase A-like enzyme
MEERIWRKSAADINAAALDWIGHDSGRPFFAFLNYLDVHDPYDPPRDYLRRYSSRPAPRRLKSDEVFYPSLTRRELQDEVDAYDAALAYVDDQIADLYSQLEQRGLAGNTIFIVTSDHGESFGEHGLYLHQNALYRELIHVPLLIVWPGHVPAGTRVAGPVSNVALASTVMDLAGDGNRRMFPDRSLAAFWSPGPPAAAAPVLAELAQFPFGTPRRLSFHGAAKAVLTEQWHLIEHEKFGIELFDWRADPQELHNLAERTDLSGVIRDLRSHAAPAWAAEDAQPAADRDD